ncbi:MAG: hypothetical protein GYA51_11755 [Candidatus Methanofastidiosa archaeon]|nr:hypothetical protein [Candidatus Methanofastidiosa archaeon]
MIINTRAKQVFQIDKFRTQLLKVRRREYPKVFIENTTGGYTVWGFKDKESKKEEIVTVLDCEDMGYNLFVNMIIGPIGYFMKATEGQIEGFLFNGGIRKFGK